eukprot:TRINITY_DN1036_c0_g5_i1.p1 TRINITY_DN1036_c0_g5~~TRINITY_DN1036_c0_g5_i1.p1  ORF type:complete len:962 (+),score=411.17 TRINITY_DN1036_c0_g5_i1:148-3033(+)
MTPQPGEAPAAAAAAPAAEGAAQSPSDVPQKKKEKKPKVKKAPKGPLTPAERAKQLIEKAKARAGKLGAGGIECVVTRKTETTPMGFDFDENLTLRSVKPESPADDAGMTRFVGMQLKIVNGTTVGGLSDCAKFMSCKVLQLGLTPVQRPTPIEGGPNQIKSEFKSPWADGGQPWDSRRPGLQPPGPPRHMYTQHDNLFPLDGLSNPIAKSQMAQQADYTMEGPEDLPLYTPISMLNCGQDSQEIMHLRRENSRILEELARVNRGVRAVEKARKPPVPQLKAAPEPSPDRYDDDDSADGMQSAPPKKRPAIKAQDADSDSDSSSDDGPGGKPEDKKGALVPAGQVLVSADKVLPVAGKPDHVMLPASAIVTTTSADAPPPGAAALGALVPVGSKGPPPPGTDPATAGALVPAGTGAQAAAGGGQLVPAQPRANRPIRTGGRDQPLVLPVRSNLAGMGHVVRQIGAPALKQALVEAQSIAMPAAPAPNMTDMERDAVIERFNQRHPIGIKVQEAMRRLDTVGLRVCCAPLPHVDRDFSDVVMSRVTLCQFRESIIRHFDKRHPVNAQVKEKLYTVDARGLHVALGPLPHAARDFSDVVMDRIRRYEEEGPPVFDEEDPDMPLMVPAEGPDGRTKMVCLGRAGMDEEEERALPYRRLPGQRVGDDDWRVLPLATHQAAKDAVAANSKPKPKDSGAVCPEGCRRLETFLCEKLWVCSSCRGKFRKGTWFHGCDYCDFDLCSACAQTEEERQLMCTAAVVVLANGLVSVPGWKCIAPPPEEKPVRPKSPEGPGPMEEDDDEDRLALANDSDDESAAAAGGKRKRGGEKQPDAKKRKREESDDGGDSDSDSDPAVRELRKQLEEACMKLASRDMLLEKHEEELKVMEADLPQKRSRSRSRSRTPPRRRARSDSRRRRSPSGRARRGDRRRSPSSRPRRDDRRGRGARRSDSRSRRNRRRNSRSGSP